MVPLKSVDQESPKLNLGQNSRSVVSEERKMNARKLNTNVTKERNKETASTRLLQLKRPSLGQTAVVKKPLNQKRAQNTLISKLAQSKQIEQNKSVSKLDSRNESAAKSITKPSGYLMSLLTPKHRASLEYNLMGYLSGSITPQNKITEVEKPSASTSNSLESSDIEKRIQTIDKKMGETLDKVRFAMSQKKKMDLEKKKNMDGLARENGLLKEKIRLLERKLG